MSGTLPETSLRDLEETITGCRLCPRLVAWREAVAEEPPLRYRDADYWARPLPGFGDPRAKIMVTGLAPAAHGSNRTGRVFTGDTAGDGLYASLHRTGFASQPDSTRADDGLELTGLWINAAVRCAPPGNRPTTTERDRCLPYLATEISLLGEVNTIVALGAFGWDCVLRALKVMEVEIPVPRPKFGHGAEVELGTMRMIGCYHPSQRNTFTGRLTGDMLDEVFRRASAVSLERSL